MSIKCQNNDKVGSRAGLPAAFLCEQVEVAGGAFLLSPLHCGSDAETTGGGVLLNCIVTDMTYNTAQPPALNGRKMPVRWAAPPALRPPGALGEERWARVGFLEAIPPAE